MTVKRIWLCAGLLPPLAVGAASRCSPRFAALWSRTVIAGYARAASGLTGRLAFPLVEILAIACGAALLTLLAAGRFRAALRLGWGLPALLLAGYGLIWYPLYFTPAGRPCAVHAPADADALARLAEGLVAALAEKDGAAACRSAPILADAPFTFSQPRPKEARYGEWMRAGRLAGLFLPWTAEAVYSPERPAAARPFTACHELAHLMGIADEGQANIAAYRACVRAGGEWARSARLQALACALPRLSALDGAAWERCVAGLDARSYADLQAMGGLRGLPRGMPGLIGRLTEWLGIRGSLEDYAALEDYLAGAVESEALSPEE